MSLPKPERRGPKPRKLIARKKRPARERKTPLGTLKRMLWSLLRLYIFDAYGTRCYTCGAGPLQGKNLQAGHFILAGSSLAVRYSPNNVRPQCFRCNISLKGNGAWYAKQLRVDIGERNYSDLFSRSRVIMQLRRADLQEMIAALRRGGVEYETYWAEVMGPRLDALACEGR